MGRSPSRTDQGTAGRVRAMTTDSVLEAQYRRRFEAEHASREAVWRVLVDAWFSRYVDGTEAVLDLGCGWGAFINHAAAPRRYGLDLNIDAARHVEDGVVLFHQSAADPWPLADGSLDLVFTSNFLEHLPGRDAIMAALGEAFRTLRPGARIVCLGPDIRYAKGDYWNFFDHIVPLTARSLTEALELVGFRADEVPALHDGRPAPAPTGVGDPGLPAAAAGMAAVRPAVPGGGRQAPDTVTAVSPAT
jgi:SAM-dependent methyltransferase